MQNPFTTTFSKIPDYTYIPTEQTVEIIDNFSYDNPSESLYKITGVRGSGKTVLLAKIEEEFTSEERKAEGWIVYRISPTRDMLKQLASALAKESFVKDQYKTKGVNISATVLGTGAGIGLSHTEQDDLFDVGVEIDEMIVKAAKKGKKILIGVDEVSKTHEMVVFASEFGKWLRAGYPVYMVCTGLYENIEQLYNVQNLTFFRRATTVKTEPLNMVRMSEMYRSKLGTDISLSKELATITKGYPYAFQELGILYFKKKDKESLEEVMSGLKTELYAYAYEKIWEEMSAEDRALVKLMVDKDEYKREEIVRTMSKPANYSIYRDRLIKRGIIVARRGYVALALPFFNEYIKEYCQ
ncbi:MAG: KAP family NTPase [Lachnospiraceae bacterium]|nr:KAP family NTPase [Lachnospiraceae bacterium]